MPTFEEAVAKARDRVLQKERAEIEYREALRDAVRMTRSSGRHHVPYREITDVFKKANEESYRATEHPQVYFLFKKSSGGERIIGGTTSYYDSSDWYFADEEGNLYWSSPADPIVSIHRGFNGTKPSIDEIARYMVEEGLL